MSGLQRASRRLIRNLTIGGLLLATAYALLGWLWDGHGLLESVLAGIALTMAILPEEIPVILTVFLALGAWRISKHKVLTRRVPAVEALGAISVLAVDKTGTLTQNRMQVAELRLVDGSCHDEDATELPEPFHALVEFAMLATPADPFDPMEKAIQQFGLHWLTDTEHVHAEWSPEFEYGLSPDILAMTRVFRGDARDAAPAGHQGRAGGGDRPVPSARRRRRERSCARSRPWPSAACACSAWPAANGRARHGRAASTTSISASSAWSVSSTRRARKCRRRSPNAAAPASASS